MQIHDIILKSNTTYNNCKLNFDLHDLTQLKQNAIVQMLED